MKTQNKIAYEMADQAEHIIYNDLPISLLYGISKTPSRFNKANLEKILLKGEKYFQIEEPSEHYVYTSKARLINTHLLSATKGTFTTVNIIHYFRGHRFRSSEVFKERGWDHDLQKLQQEYKDRGWEYNINTWIKTKDKL